MGAFIDLTDKTFGRLYVVEEAGRDKWKRATWLCKCECGNEVVVAGYCMINGNTKSCGCLRKEMISKRLSGKKHHNYIEGRKCDNRLAYARFVGAKRHAAKLNQTPDNVNLDIIRFYYTISSTLKDYEVDHIKPLSKGGLHHEDNLQLLDISLNRQKNNKWPLTKEEKVKYTGLKL